MVGNSELHIVGAIVGDVQHKLSSGFSEIGVFSFHQGVRFPDRKRGRRVDSNSVGGWGGGGREDVSAARIVNNYRWTRTS